MNFRHGHRGGAYYRVCDPSLTDCADTTYSKRYGGRWNPAGTFGALYLTASLSAAVAHARRALRLQFGEAITFDDLQETARPHLVHFFIEEHEFVDGGSNDGRTAMGPSQALGLIAWQKHEAGIAARSAVLETEDELALFDTHLHLQQMGAHEPFETWYPGVG